MTRDLSLLLVAFLLLALESALGSVTQVGAFMPNLVLPIVIYLGITQEIPLWRVAVLSALLGALVDTASGNALGLMTFVHVATLVAVRAGSLRLLMRGRLSQVAITALLAALGALLVIALRSLFRANPQVPSTSTRHWLIATLVPSIATGLVAPFVIQLVRRVDARSRRDETATLSRRPSEA
ncbi:MAG: rod shape-determining protein MreD [Polyangiales bacterium]